MVVAGLAARTQTRLDLCPSVFRLGKADKACEELVSSKGCEAWTLALESGLGQTGKQMLAGEGGGNEREWWRAAEANRWAYFRVAPGAFVGGGRAQRSRIRGIVGHHMALWAVMVVVPAMKPTIKFVRTRDTNATGRRDILVPGIVSSSKNVLCRCGDCHCRITSLQFCHIRRLAILAKKNRRCLGLLDSPCEMRWKCRLAGRGRPTVPTAACNLFRVCTASGEGSG
jgi:hypothetical protein